METCDEEIKDEREAFYIKKYNTVHPNGYNLDGGGQDTKHPHEESIELQASKMRGKPRNFIAPRKREEDKDLPVGVTYIKTNTGEGYRGTFDGQKKAFTSAGYTMQEKLEKATETREGKLEIEKGSKTKIVRKHKEDNNLPKYVHSRVSETGKFGYRVAYLPTNENRRFTSKTVEENLEDALAFLAKCIAGEDTTKEERKDKYGNLLPEGLQFVTTHSGTEGYRVHSKVYGHKSFVNKNLPLKKVYKMAVKYLEKKIKEKEEKDKKKEIKKNAKKVKPSQEKPTDTPLVEPKKKKVSTGSSAPKSSAPTQSKKTKTKVI